MSENCWQITGPPGTGKTTWLARNALLAAEKYGGAKIVIASLTRAAAFEFSSRGLKMVPDDQIGTLHMICKRVLGSPDLTEGKARDWAEFLAQEKAPARFAISEANGQAGMDRTTKLTDGDKLLQRLTVLRNQYPGIFRNGSALPKGIHLTNSQHAFLELWTTWKGEAELMDFTDLVEECTEHVEYAPGNPQVLFGDEAQDWSQLEIELFRDHWGARSPVRKVILVGDADQAIYEWRGANPRIFLDHPVPEGQKILLSQSHRVPRTVRDCALRWIESKIQAREPVKYESRPEAGFAGQVQATYKAPRRLLPLIEEILAAGETVMVMGSCDYMLRPLLKELRTKGIPYGNPYRAGDKSWNPLRRGSAGNLRRRKETTKLDRVLAFLEPSFELRGKHLREWTWGDVSLWCDPLGAVGDDAAMGLRAKADLSILVKNQKVAGEVTMQSFLQLFRENHGDLASKMSLDWWFASMRPKEAPKYAYYENVIKHSGQRALIDEPRCFVGTIHSFKGGEADNVILFPDLSPAAAEEYEGPYPDPTVRLFYVAMTRARSNLVVCHPASRLHAEVGKGLPCYQRLRDEEPEVPF